MNFIGSKTLETDRLILKAQTMNEQRRLWEILMIPEVNDVYLTTPSKFREKLKDWEKQEPFYEKKIERANDGDVFEWSIFLKENNKCIGKIDYHEGNSEDSTVNDKSIRGVGWYIDPEYQGLGYGTEAAKVTLDYMFKDVNISEIRTGAAIFNEPSFKIMDKLGFKRLEDTQFVNYTYRDEPVEDYKYVITKDDYFNK
ncbi:MAG: GNAT family N-acetyltransferase [Firmicutes bacterium]|nr:GNAT family N-acetyltransferase [Bacillota bacterium]